MSSLEDLRREKDAAYAERNKLVALLATLYPSSLEKHPALEEWEDDWAVMVVWRISS